MTKAWRVEILDFMSDMVLARFYYNNGVAIRFKAKVDGATYSGTVAVVRMLEVGSVGGFMELIYYVVGGLAYGL